MNRWFYGLGMVFVGLMTVDVALGAPKTFYMDEGTHYSDIGMCKNADLNTVTASLATAMRADGCGENGVSRALWYYHFIAAPHEANCHNGEMGRKWGQVT